MAHRVVMVSSAHAMGAPALQREIRYGSYMEGFRMENREERGGSAMAVIEVTPDELSDIIMSLGGKLSKRTLGGYGGKDRLALRARLEGLVPEREGNAPLASHPVYGEE